MKKSKCNDSRTVAILKDSEAGPPPAVCTANLSSLTNSGAK